LEGIGAGETRTLKVSFPKNYASEKLAGQLAEFETTASLVEAPQEVEINDEFRKTPRFRIARQAEGGRSRAAGGGIRPVRTRQRVKRMLLDRLDESPQVRGAAPR